MKRTRQYSINAIAIFAAFALTACAPDLSIVSAEQTATATPQENRDALGVLFDDTQALLAGDWKNEDDPEPFPCDPASGGDGVQYSLIRSAEGAPEANDRQVIADRVAEFWKTHGYTTTRSEAPTFGSEVRAINDERSNLLFSVSENATTLHGGSDCTPGSWDDIMDKLLKEEEAELQE